jgi:hypothetical protein
VQIGVTDSVTQKVRLAQQVAERAVVAGKNSGTQNCQNAIEKFNGVNFFKWTGFLKKSDVFEWF